jgi:hypothetical protein
MTQLQVNTLNLFEHHKKWSAPLLVMKDQIDLSTAHRRLSSLIDLELIGRQRSGYRSTGGRFPDLFYLTSQGAAVLNRALNKSEHRVKAPGIVNPISNEHDLLVLEMAVRLGDWDRLHHRQKLTFDVHRESDEEWTDFEPTGEQISLVPDLHFSDAVHQSEIYFEVEQTVRYQHILRKYQAYQEVSFYHYTQDSCFYLWTVFANSRQEYALTPDHERACDQVGMDWDSIFFANMDDLRECNVRNLDELWRMVGYA